MYFRNYGLPKMWLDNCLKSPVSEGPSRSNTINEPKHLLKSERHQNNHIYWSQWIQSRPEKSLLVICKILRLGVNTFTDYEKFYVLNRDNLLRPNSCELWNILKKKMTLIPDVFPKFRTPIDAVRWLSKKCYFGGSLDKQHPKRLKTLLKSGRQPDSLNSS